MNCFLEPLRKNATSFVLPSLTAVIISRITNATTMSTPTFHSTTGIVYVIFKNVSIIDDEKTKEITTVHVAVFHM